MATQRALFSALLRSTPTAPGTSVSRTVAAGVPVAWVEPPQLHSDALIFYLHGGGYSWGSIRSHLSFVSQIAATVGCKALLVDYRRAPEHPFPAAFDDALAAYRWMCHRDPESRVAIVGESAGGGLALSLMLTLKQSNALPEAGCLLSPWVDLDGRATGNGITEDAAPTPVTRYLRKTAERYADGANLQDPRMSPVYGDLSGLPALLIHAGQNEFLARDAVVLADKLRRQGVNLTFDQYTGRVHVLHTFVHLSKRAREYLLKASSFLRDHLRPGPQ